EGWEEAPLDEAAQALAELLDGRTDLATAARVAGLAPFPARKAVSDLVHAGVARRCTADEIEDLAHDAVANGDDEEALRLLRAAVEVEVSNRELRSLLASILERTGAVEEAAAEYALLGHAAEQQGEQHEALQHYARAVALTPDDVPLREKHVALLHEASDVEALVPAVLDLVAAHATSGLLDRACKVLSRTIESHDLHDHEELVSALANAEAALGLTEQAAKTHRELADRLIARDEGAALVHLRAAFELCPDDALGHRIDDLEAGRVCRRRRRRRIVRLAA